MNNLAPIKDWLNNGGTYAEGVELLLQATTDQSLHELFAEAESDFKRKLLKEELKALVMASPALINQPVIDQVINQENVIQDLQDENDTKDETIQELQEVIDMKDNQIQQLEQTKPVHIKTPGRWSHPDHRDETEKSLHDEWHPLFLEMQHHRNTIYEVAKAGAVYPEKKTEACHKAQAIIKLSKQCREIYKKRDHYFKHGVLPYEAPPLEQYAVDPIAAVKDLENRKRYVRTMKANLAKNPDDQNSQQLLARHRAAVDHYKKLLNIT